MDVKWVTSQVIFFLKIYQQHECLWDPQSPLYVKRHERSHAFESILEQLIKDGYKITHEQLKCKIKSLRDTYRNEANKVKKSIKSGATGDNIYRPKLAWFSNADAFLGKLIKGSDSTPHVEEEISFDVPDSDGNDDPLVEEKKSTSYSDSGSKIKRERISPLKIGTPISLAQKRAKIAPARFQRTVKKFHERRLLTGEVHEDQYDSFGKHIGAQLRELPLRSYLLLQDKIQQIITQERVSCLNKIENVVTEEMLVEMAPSTSTNSLILEEFEEFNLHR